MARSWREELRGRPEPGEGEAAGLRGEAASEGTQDEGCAAPRSGRSAALAGGGRGERPPRALRAARASPPPPPPPPWSPVWAVRWGWGGGSKAPQAWSSDAQPFALGRRRHAGGAPLQAGGPGGAGRGCGRSAGSGPAGRMKTESPRSASRRTRGRTDGGGRGTEARRGVREEGGVPGDVALGGGWFRPGRPGSGHASPREPESNPVRGSRPAAREPQPEGCRRGWPGPASGASRGGDQTMRPGPAPEAVRPIGARGRAL